MKSIIRLFQLLLIPTGVLSLTRLIFYLWNIDLYENLPLSVFIFGLHFDLAALCIYFSPFIFFYLLSNHFQKLRIVEKIFFIVGILSISLMNLIDTAFIAYSNKRSGIELFAMNKNEGELLGLLPSYIKDYWFLIILLVVIMYLSIKLYHKLSDHSATFSIKQVLLYIAIIVLVIFGIRGRFINISARPLDIVDASTYTKVSYIPVVLNTPFVMIKSMEKASLETVYYFSDNELNNVFSLKKNYFKPNKSEIKPNVFIIILESFGPGYIGALNNGKGYTPFLDSLMQEGTLFTNAYANGTHSIESVPSLLSSIPSLINEGLIFSSYSNANVNSLPNILGSHGYHSAFFHGAFNGSMNFDSYTKLLGFNEYYGRNEYNNDEHFDGKWGIYDHHFLKFTAETVNQFKEPFLTTVFTLSSHHPYKVPKELENKFKGGDLEIHKTIEYTDWSLNQFFNYAKQQDWYNNTLFVISSDHWAYHKMKHYTSLNRFSIPIAFFHPTDTLLQHKIDTSLISQIDIFPTIMDYLSWNYSFNAFGNSVFDDKASKCFYSLVNGIYQYYENDTLIYFDGEKTTSVFDVKNDVSLKNNLLDSVDKTTHENKIKAIIQQFNNRLISNTLSAE